MKKTLYFLITLFVIAGCKTTPPTKKLVAYKGMYGEKPLSLLIMPPINKSTNVEAKEFFHSTLLVPFASKGFYVIPPFLSMEILKKESAYDSEQFIEAPLAKFGGGFGALASLAASAIKTAATNYTKVARACNNYTLSDLPQGIYGPKFMADSAEFAGRPVFRATIK